MDSHGSIVTKIFEEFLSKIDAEKTIDVKVSQRLRATLLENREFDQDALRAAFFAEDEIT